MKNFDIMSGKEGLEDMDAEVSLSIKNYKIHFHWSIIMLFTIIILKEVFMNTK